MLWKDIEWINAGFSGLYQGKDTYGFKFIRRQQQSLQSQNNTEPIDDTISAVNKIQRHLNQEQDILIDVYLEVKALLNQLKDLCKLFEDPKATEGVNYSRMACLENMRCISLDAEDSITIYINSAKGRENHLDNTGHGSKLRMEIKRIKHTINLLNRRMQGIGKTTLAKIVYNHKAIVNHFPFRAWVSVPQESNDVNTLVEDVGNRVLKIGELQEEPDGKDFWINKMNKFLKEKKFLLVLDNILTKEAWDTLKEAFPKTTNGKALKEVVERCGGLPQAIEYLVDKISGKDVTALDLRWVPINEHFQNGWSKTLENEDLSEGLKKCFSYFRLFPSNFEIPTRRLIALWVAQGVVKQSDVEKETQEDVAEKYLSELIGLNMIQVVQKKINGKVKTCRLPNALLELCLSKCEGTKPGEDIENFLRKAISSGCFKVLKVLDLERLFRPQLPNAIGNLIELKYLGLRWTYLEMIPSSIELRHLYLNQIYRSKFVHQPSSSSSKNLQTLWGVFVGEDGHLKDGLEKWTNLRKLGLALQLPLQQQRALAKCVVKLNNLECLSLRSIDEMSKPQVLYMESLSGMENLTSLYLFGKLEIPSIISEFPQSLSDLTLSASGLKNDPMPALNKLPNLKSLCLYSGSYERREMVCSRGRFTKLLVLKLWKLEMLEELQVEEGAMQNLRELDIRSCKELKFPTGLKHLKNLRELNSWGMPEEFTTRIEEIRGKFGMPLPISNHY
ncbi:putative disease resistance protein At1g50180 [Castanea sativa]|uniref:putative disease resistance protein At1g50180 n=1 Tax=Castanea sativa TaxID=21020 RepID=UPI003F64A7B2